MKKRKVISLEDKVPKFKQARKRKANRRLIWYLCLFFILISLIVYLQSPLSDIKKIEVNGNKYIDEKRIIKLSGIQLKNNIWSTDLKKAERKLSKSPFIKNAKVKRKFPTTIELSIKEERLVGYIIENQKYYPLLANGTYINNPEKVMSGKAPLLHGFSDDEYLQKMSEELAKLDKTIYKLISEIYWNPTEDNKSKILLYMQDGFVIDGSIHLFHEKMNVYPSIISQLEEDQKGIIHLGVGAYFEDF